MKKLGVAIVITAMVYIPCSLIWMLSVNHKAEVAQDTADSLAIILHHEQRARFFMDSLAFDHLALYDWVLFPVEEPTREERDSMENIMEKLREEDARQ